jgi:hypothetical protein
MTSKRLSKLQKRDIAALRAMKNSEINLMDIPEILDWPGAVRGKFFRPEDQKITNNQKTRSSKRINE